ncbi:MAG: aminomethyltransferase beta-barrel domain-containing protein, partial [Chloroflexota bacterium]|nr:aminomethyltransferase beta-barrel domain-containing protein [Chloroflexota bacterium]
YARIEKSGERFLLKKNRDSNKDQSYFLYRLTQDQLKRAMMPLGSYTKEKGRQLAHELHLPVADKRESQEICFISDNDYRAFVARQIPLLTKSGPITDRAGNLLGEHHGIIDYTIGQRHGLGIAAKEPLYVLEVDSKRNAVIVGSKKQVYADEMIVSEVNWIACDEPQHPLAGKVKIRYRHKESSALLTPLHDGNVRIRFEQPQMAITPGQSAVFYRDDVVLGGGTIMGQG